MRYLQWNVFWIKKKNILLFYIFCKDVLVRYVSKNIQLCPGRTIVVTTRHFFSLILFCYWKYAAKIMTKSDPVITSHTAPETTVLEYAICFLKENGYKRFNFFLLCFRVIFSSKSMDQTSEFILFLLLYVRKTNIRARRHVANFRDSSNLTSLIYC